MRKAQIQLSSQQTKYRSLNATINTVAGDLVTVDDVEAEMDGEAVTQTADEAAVAANITFGFMRAGGDPSIYEKQFFRKKDDEDDDMFSLALTLVVCVPDILDYLPVPPVEEKAEPERDASAAPLAPVR